MTDEQPDDQQPEEKPPVVVIQPFVAPGTETTLTFQQAVSAMQHLYPQGGYGVYDGAPVKIDFKDLQAYEDPQLLAAASVSANETAWAEYQVQAQAALDASDDVATRCVKAGVAYPPEWFARDKLLRAIVKASSGDATQPLPSQPSYPAGT